MDAGSQRVTFTITVSGPENIMPEVEKDLRSAIRRNLKAWESVNGVSYQVETKTTSPLKNSAQMDLIEYLDTLKTREESK
jgi:hypothetical protein